MLAESLGGIIRRLTLLAIAVVSGTFHLPLTKALGNVVWFQSMLPYFGLPFTYAIAYVLGVPAYFSLKRFRWLSPAAVIASSAALGAVANTLTGAWLVDWAFAPHSRR